MAPLHGSVATVTDASAVDSVVGNAERTAKLRRHYSKLRVDVLEKWRDVSVRTRVVEPTAAAAAEALASGRSSSD